MDMRIFPRDSHHDIMNEFLKEGKWMSIPVAVFYTGDHDYICHWIERPAVAEREMHQIEVDIRAENPDIDDQAFRTRAPHPHRRQGRRVDRPPPSSKSANCWRRAFPDSWLSGIESRAGLNRGRLDFLSSVTI